MTAVAPAAAVDPTAAKARRSMSPAVIALILLGALVALSFTRAVSGANSLTAGGTVGATITLGLPIALAGLGGLWSERAGVVNIGLEGMLILGTWFGAAFAYYSGSPWMGVLGGIVGGLLGGLVHAIATVTFGVDQIVSGVAVTILAGGVAKYLSGVFFSKEPGGGSTQSPSIPSFAKLKFPGADDSLGKLENHHWFLISDVAGLLRGIATGLTPLYVLAILLIPATWFILWRTTFGLRLRLCGENPDEAESQGVRVYTTKYIAVLISGALAGLGGTVLADFGGLYREGQTGGRGYIGLAAMIFGNWRPGGLASGAGLFGYTDAVQSRGGATAVHALLLFVAILLVAVAAYTFWQGGRHTPIITLIVAAGVFVLYATTSSVPQELVTTTPYVITLLVLILASQRLRMPAADGVPWRRGQAG
jgi:simple sugar transport system permease protein